MAYIAEDDKEKSQTSGATPLSGGQAPMSQPTEPQGDSAPTPALQSSGAQPMQQQSNQSQQAQPSKKASSGMFTNIQRYVEKNRPQAQKMGQAVQQDVAGQAADIRQATEKKQQEMEQKIAANQQTMQDAQQEAQNIVGGIMGTSPQQQQQPTMGGGGMGSPEAGATTGEQAQPAQKLTAGPVPIPTEEDELRFQKNLERTGGPQQRPQPTGPAYGTVNDQGMYYAGSGSSSQLSDILAGRDPSERKFHTQDIRDFWVTEDQYNQFFKQNEPQPAQPQLTPEEQQARFQQIMAGDIGMMSIADPNIAAETNRMKALQRMAAGAATEQGRKNLLRGTFGDRGAYTRGMSGLDQLILSGDQAAREGLIQGVTKQGTQLGQDLSGMERLAREKLAEHRLAQKGFGSEIEGLATGAQGQITDEAKARMEEIRNKLYGEDGQFGAISEAATAGLTGALKYKSADDLLKSIMGGLNTSWSKGGDRGTWDKYQLEKLLTGGTDKTLEDWANSRKVGGFIRSRNEALARAAGIGQEVDRGEDGPAWSPVKYQYDAAELEKALQERGDEIYKASGLTNLDKNVVLQSGVHNALQQNIQNMLANAKEYGLDPNKYAKELAGLGKAGTFGGTVGWSGGHQSQDVGDVYSYDMEKFQDVMGRLYGDIEGARQNTISKMLENKYKDYGVTGEQFKSGDFLDVAGVANQEELNKMEALNKLLGRQTHDLGVQGVGQDTAFLDKLRKDFGIA